MKRKILFPGYICHCSFGQASLRETSTTKLSPNLIQRQHKWRQEQNTYTLEHDFCETMMNGFMLAQTCLMIIQCLYLLYFASIANVEIITLYR